MMSILAPINLLPTLLIFTSALAHPQEAGSDILPPPPCPIPTWTAQNLTFHNTTHNLDCERGPDVGNGTICIGQTCAVSVCSTGLSPQPPGYGPPDTFRINITGTGDCFQSFPGTVPRRAIGDSYIRCGGSQPTLFFHGNSESSESEAFVRIDTQYFCENDEGKTIWVEAKGEKSFTLKCEHDEERNATCTADEFTIPLTNWSNWGS